LKISEFSLYEEFVNAAILEVTMASERAIKKNRSFKIVLSGGETPIPIYKKLAKQNLDWNCWHIWLADERGCSVDETVLNWEMIKKSLLDHVSIPEENLHRIKTEEGVESAALLYSHTLQEVTFFDMAILGLGEDGHTASLFPGIDRKNEDIMPSAFAIFESPKPPSDRVTLSAERLCTSDHVLFLVSGNAKKNSIISLIAGDDIPATGIYGKISTKLFYYSRQ
jgi:6-phosphogluconolactonase